MSFWSVYCWSAKYTVHPNFFLGTFYFSNLLGTRFQKNLVWEDPGGVGGGWTYGVLAPGLKYNFLAQNVKIWAIFSAFPLSSGLFFFLEFIYEHLMANNIQSLFLVAHWKLASRIWWISGIFEIVLCLRFMKLILS